MIFITDELGKFEKNIIELAENVGFKECKTKWLGPRSPSHFSV